MTLSHLKENRQTFMKKILLFALVGILPLIFLGCNGSGEVLYVLNWGEYINEDLVAQFTEDTGIVVEISTVDSNEKMKEALELGTSTFDIVIPSDYMVEYLYDNDYLQKIDLSKLTNFAEDNFMDGVNDIMGQLFQDNSTVDSAYEVGMPYFWGLFGLMYNDDVPGLQEYIEANGWGAIFGPDESGISGLRFGIYSIPRFVYSAALLYAASEDSLYPGVTDNAMNIFSSANVSLVESILGQRTYTAFGTDQMKKDIDSDELDVAFTYAGDFFDTYLTNCVTENATNSAEAEAANAHLGIYIPSQTIAFVDCMVIPKNSENVDNAYTFMNYFLDPENAYINSDIVGYTTTLKATYDMIKNATKGDVVRQAMVQNHPYDPMTIQGVVGTPLIIFTDDQTSDIDTMFTRVVNAN